VREASRRPSPMFTAVLLKEIPDRLKSKVLPLPVSQLGVL
jgi:hypothetical protein